MAQAQPTTNKPAAAAQPDEEAGRWLMTQMALLESLRQLPEQLDLGLQQAQAQGMPPELAKLVLRSGLEVYDIKQLEPQALALLLKSLGPEHLQAWTTFYKTPLGQKVGKVDMTRGYMKDDIGYLIVLLIRVMGLPTVGHLQTWMVHFIDTIRTAKMPIDWATIVSDNWMSS